MDIQQIASNSTIYLCSHKDKCFKKPIVLINWHIKPQQHDKNGDFVDQISLDISQMAIMVFFWHQQYPQCSKIARANPQLQSGNLIRTVSDIGTKNNFILSLFPTCNAQPNFPGIPNNLSLFLNMNSAQTQHSHNPTILMPFTDHLFCPLGISSLPRGISNFIHVVVLHNLILWTLMCSEKVQESNST